MSFPYDVVEEVARSLYGRALKLYPPDVKESIREAHAKETNPTAKHHLRIMLESIAKAEQRDVPVCQDTGMQTVWVQAGTAVALDGHRLQQSIREGVRRWSAENRYRVTPVHPLTRVKVGEQVGLRHPTIYWDFIPDKDYLEILLLSKGSGSENQGFLAMLVPAQGVAGIKKFVLDSVFQAGGQFCPPGIAGIGIGGTFDRVARLAKEALLRPIGASNPDPEIAKLERELLDAINASGIGPMGLGGDTTLLGLAIEYAVTHETQNPVALNLQCWAHRKAGARIFPDGRYEYIYEFGGPRHE